MSTVLKKSEVGIKSLERDSISIKLRYKLEAVPKCHNKETFTVIRVIKTDDGIIERELVDIDAAYGLTVLQQDDKFAPIYYSDKEQKIQALQILKESVQDLFFDDAPNGEFEELFGDIEKLKSKIDKLL